MGSSKPFEPSKSSSESLHVTSYPYGRGIVVKLAGELDMATAGELDQTIRTALGNAPEVLVLDLTNLKFLDSAGLGVLVKGHNASGQTAFRLVVTSPAIQRPLELTGLDQVFEMFDSLDAALTY